MLFICLLLLKSLIMFNNLLNELLCVGGWKSMFKRLVAVGAAAFTVAATMALPATAWFGARGFGINSFSSFGFGGFGLGGLGFGGLGFGLGWPFMGLGLGGFGWPLWGGWW